MFFCIRISYSLPTVFQPLSHSHSLSPAHTHAHTHTHTHRLIPSLLVCTYHKNRLSVTTNVRLFLSIYLLSFQFVLRRERPQHCCSVQTAASAQRYWHSTTHAVSIESCDLQLQMISPCPCLCLCFNLRYFVVRTDALF